jgi:hypothetical protein
MNVGFNSSLSFHIRTSSQHASHVLELIYAYKPSVSFLLVVGLDQVGGQEQPLNL